MECEYQIKGTTLRIFSAAGAGSSCICQTAGRSRSYGGDTFYQNDIFDFSGTDWMDSSGIGVILGRYKNMKLSGGHVYAVHLNERMKKIFAMSGMEHLMEEE